VRKSPHKGGGGVSKHPLLYLLTSSSTELVSREDNVISY
jgi:hypothetical protein